MRPCLLAALAAASIGAAGTASAAQARPAGGRVMAPAQVTCDPNQLTSYFGRVVGYRRNARETWLRIATDYDTVEEVTIAHGTAKDARARFLLQGAPFGVKDWAVIEKKPGVLRKGVRATAWVCSDGSTPPLVDWNGAAE